MLSGMASHSGEHLSPKRDLEGRFVVVVELVA